MKIFRRPSSQRGATLFGMVFLAVVVGFFMLMGARVFPYVNEYLTIRRAVAQIVKNNPSSASEVRNAFERTTEIEYSIHSITAKDLVIKPNGERLTVSFAYNAEIPVIEPVFLLIKFEGSGKTGGSSGP